MGKLEDYEKPVYLQMNSQFVMLAKDYPNQMEDTDLFPGLISDDILSKVCPVAIWTSEFDFYKRDNLVYYERLKKLGKTVELCNMPGTPHGFQLFYPGKPEFNWFFEEEKLVFDTWVNKA